MTHGAAETRRARRKCKVFAADRSKYVPLYDERRAVMDSQDKEKSKIRRREETLVRRVGEALDRMNSPGTAECPDAEVIAAYAEQALGAAESGHWEGHFASCARCRNILRVLAASADTPLAAKEVAHLGELVSSSCAPAEIAGRPVGRARPWYMDWRMRWLAPAFGVAAVLAVWFAIRPPWRATRPGASETLVAQAPKEEAPLRSSARRVGPGFKNCACRRKKKRRLRLHPINPPRMHARSIRPWRGSKKSARMPPARRTRSHQARMRQQVRSSSRRN